MRVKNAYHPGIFCRSDAGTSTSLTPTFGPEGMPRVWIGGCELARWMAEVAYQFAKRGCLRPRFLQTCEENLSSSTS